MECEQVACMHYMSDGLAPLQELHACIICYTAWLLCLSCIHAICVGLHGTTECVMCMHWSGGMCVGGAGGYCITI